MSEASTTPERRDPHGIGGWLLLPAIGLAVAPLRLGGFMLGTYLPLFQKGTWDALTTPGSAVYHALWGPIIVFEGVCNVGFIAAYLALLVLMFRHSRRFPGLYIGVTLGNLGIILFDAWLGTLVPSGGPMFDPEVVRELGRSLGAAVVWVPYMLMSRRVLVTFVR